MPDITPDDWIKIGGGIAACFMALIGWVKGGKDHRAEPPEPAMAMLGASIVDRTTLQDLTAAVKEVAAALRQGTASNERIREDEIAEQVKENSEKLDDVALALKHLQEKRG